MTDHYPRVLFFTDPAYLSVWVVRHFVQGDVWVLGETALLAWLLGRLYYHEKDKIKRTARALGRVFIGEHGRLVVE